MQQQNDESLKRRRPCDTTWAEDYAEQNYSLTIEPPIYAFPYEYGKMISI
jgi:hypothetical protein